MTKKITAYKGFDKDFKCRGFQFEVGKDYEHDGDVVACASGFHACEFPFDVWNYYDPASNRFAVVELAGKTAKHDDDTKIAAAKITVSAELTLPEFIQAGVDWILAKTKDAKSNTGYKSAATNTGDQSAATNTGNRSAATNTGYKSAATNTGYQSAATNTGYKSAATNTGNRSAATNTGNQSAATNTGYKSAATNTGYQSAATNTGNQSAATNTGNRSAVCVEGKGSIALNVQSSGKQKASMGSGFVFGEHDDGGNLIAIHHGIPGQNGIKPDVWYCFRDGKIVEAEK